MPLVLHDKQRLAHAFRMGEEESYNVTKTSVKSTLVEEVLHTVTSSSGEDISPPQKPNPAISSRLRLSALTSYPQRCFLAFSLVFSLMIAALEVTEYLSNTNQGLATVHDGYHYFWTYGPTLGRYLLNKRLLKLEEPLQITRKDNTSQC